MSSMTQTQEATILAAIVLTGLLWCRTGCSPAELLHLAALHMRASWLWARRECWPAVRHAAQWYPKCVREVRRWE